MLSPVSPPHETVKPEMVLVIFSAIKRSEVLMNHHNMEEP